MIRCSLDEIPQHGEVECVDDALALPSMDHFSPAVEHDSPHLTIDASWAGKGLLCDLAYASIERLRACFAHKVSFVIRLKGHSGPSLSLFPLPSVRLSLPL